MHIGAAAPPTLRRRARERLGPVVAHTYGASEIGIVSALSPAEHDPAHPERFTCAGRIHPGVDVRFRRPDATLAEDGEAGSIEVRSPAMAAGYRNRPVEQAAAFRDGWYRTGDLGRLDDEGYLHTRVPRTEQGKPDRPTIRALGRVKPRVAQRVIAGADARSRHAHGRGREHLTP